jgi:hypothetical protein
MSMRLLFFQFNQNSFLFLHSVAQRTLPFLLRQLQHDVRDLDILLRLVLGGDFENDVLLVGGDGLLADGLDESGHPVWRKSLLVCYIAINRVWDSVHLLHGKTVLVL